MITRRVVVETPFSGDVKRNIAYMRACLRDCFFEYNEAPFSSHGLYTQRGILDDNSPEERRIGIEAGFEIVRDFDASIVYSDLGISGGMKLGIEEAGKRGRKVEYRTLGSNWGKKQAELLARSGNHPFSLAKVMM